MRIEAHGLAIDRYDVAEDQPRRQVALVQL